VIPFALLGYRLGKIQLSLPVAKNGGCSTRKLFTGYDLSSKLQVGR
jgi:hypothetical protein